MGRKKIAIKKIEDKQQRNITFHKRKIGLLKKAYQLSQLCNLQVYLLFNDPQGNIFQFRTDDISTLEKQEVRRYNLSPKDYPKFITRSKVDGHKVKKEEDLQIKLQEIPIPQLQENFQEEQPPQSKYSVISNFFFPPPPIWLPFNN